MTDDKIESHEHQVTLTDSRASIGKSRAYQDAQMAKLFRTGPRYDFRMEYVDDEILFSCITPGALSTHVVRPQRQQKSDVLGMYRYFAGSNAIAKHLGLKPDARSIFSSSLPMRSFAQELVPAESELGRHIEHTGETWQRHLFADSYWSYAEAGDAVRRIVAFDRTYKGSRRILIARLLFSLLVMNQYHADAPKQIPER